MYSFVQYLNWSLAAVQSVTKFMDILFENLDTPKHAIKNEFLVQNTSTRSLSGKCLSQTYAE